MFRRSSASPADWWRTSATAAKHAHSAPAQRSSAAAPKSPPGPRRPRPLRALRWRPPRPRPPRAGGAAVAAALRSSPYPWALRLPGAVALHRLLGPLPAPRLHPACRAIQSQNWACVGCKCERHPACRAARRVRVCASVSGARCIAKTDHHADQTQRAGTDGGTAASSAPLPGPCTVAGALRRRSRQQPAQLRQRWTFPPGEHGPDVGIVGLVLKPQALQVPAQLQHRLQGEG